MKIVFMGTPDFAVPSLRLLIQEGYDVQAVVTQPDRPKGRKYKVTPSPVKVEAQKHHLPILQPEKLSDPDACEQILSYRPDLIITAAYGQILPKVLLDSPPLGAINVHASLLPKYRGAAPIHRAILDGEKVTGVTIMYMVEEMDAGDMIAQTEVPILEEDDVGKLHDRLAVAGAKLLVEVLPKLLKGEAERIPQDHQQATYAPKLTREDERINWSRSADTIYNQVRGLRPWPGAFTMWRNQVLKIWQVEKWSGDYTGEPGTIVDILHQEDLIVMTGSGCLRIKELQPAGKKRLTSEAFVRGRKIEIGERFE